MSNSIYDKELLQKEAIKSHKIGRLTEPLGDFILEISDFIARSHFQMDEHRELGQQLIDSAVLRVCEEFLERFDPEFDDSSAATLIYSLILSQMKNRLKARGWKDDYGQNSKSWTIIVTESGERKKVLTKSIRDENISKYL